VSRRVIKEVRHTGKQIVTTESTSTWYVDGGVGGDKANSKR
jgi:hypothetical protein